MVRVSVRTLRNLRASAPLLAAVAVLWTIIVGAGCLGDQVAKYSYQGERTADFFATFSGGPSLGLQPDGGKDAWAPDDAGATSGAANTLATYEGSGGTVGYEFKLAAVPANYFLNLSKPVSGVVYWESTLTATKAAYTLDNARIRAELWSGTTRVGGTERTFSLCADKTNCASTDWQALILFFRPEVSEINQGTPLTLKVFRTGGLSDFTLGTGGSHQSFVELHYFDVNPLAGPVYVDDGKLITFGDGQGSQKELLKKVDEMQASGQLARAKPGPIIVSHPASSSSDARAVAFGLVGGLPLAAALVAKPRRRRPTRFPLLASLLVLMVGFAGCTSQHNVGAAVKPNQSLSANYVDDPNLKGVGALQGKVVDAEIQLPMAGAHVALLGTSYFTSTDRNGAFALGNVTAGKYRLHVDKEQFEVVEQDVRVDAGKRVLLLVNMTRSGNVAQRAHSHAEMWGSGNTYTLLDGVSLLPMSVDNEDTSTVLPNQFVCAARVTCATPIQLPVDRVVPPGAGLVVVRVDWDSGGNAPKAVELHVTTTGNATESTYVQRGPNDPFNVRFFPNEADPGHQSFTQWSFTLEFQPGDAFYDLGSGPLATIGGPVKIWITAYKVVVPLEPPHRDMWAGKSQIKVVARGDTRSAGVVDYPNSGLFWQPIRGAFVPPGTKELQGTLYWRGYQVAPAPAVPVTPEMWTIAYKGADTPDSRWQEGLHSVKEVSRTSSSVTFTIPMIDRLADEFYQPRSYWVFYADDQSPPTAAGEGNGLGEGNVLDLEVTAVKDPNYTF